MVFWRPRWDRSRGTSGSWGPRVLKFNKGRPKYTLESQESGVPKVEDQKPREILQNFRNSRFQREKKNKPRDQDLEFLRY